MGCGVFAGDFVGGRHSGSFPFAGGRSPRRGGWWSAVGDLAGGFCQAGVDLCRAPGQVVLFGVGLDGVDAFGDDALEQLGGAAPEGGAQR
jgi:hypothetical protein